MNYTLKIGQKAPNFNLKATDGELYQIDNFNQGKGFVVVFTCNHCPYVIGSNENTRKLAEKYASIPFVAINSNSPNTYQEDSFEHMVELMHNERYPWTYLHDSDQKTALAYGALKTPHFYLFNAHSDLVYTGRAIDHPRDHTQSTTHELQDAIEDLLANQPIRVPLTNPIGCNVKWEGKPKHWMPPQACDIV